MYKECKWQEFMSKTNSLGWKETITKYPTIEKARSAANALRNHLKYSRRDNLYKVSQRGNMVTLTSAI